MTTKEGLSIAEARQVVADFPKKATLPMMMEAVNEIVARVTGLDIEIPRPSQEEIATVEGAIQNGIDKLSLFYLPGYNPTYRYPNGFKHRLSGEGLKSLDRYTLALEQGWRIADISKVTVTNNPNKQPIWTYEGDEEFLGPILMNLRETGDLPFPADFMLGGIPLNSRQVLTPAEITNIVAPKADELLRLPKGTMKLPTLREAMVSSELYGFVPMESKEWQMVRFAFNMGSNRNLAAGLQSSHNAEKSSDYYYQVRPRSKHLHYPDVGFRLIGKLL